MAAVKSPRFASAGAARDDDEKEAGKETGRERGGELYGRAGGLDMYGVLDR